MKAKETQLWKWLSASRKIFRQRLHIDRLENSVGQGMPDVEGHLDEIGQFWIELKTVAWPKRDTTPIRPKMRPKQAPWLKRRWKVGGNAWVLIQIGSGPSSLRILVPGGHAEEIEHGVSEKRLRRIGIVVKTPEQTLLACRRYD